MVREMAVPDFSGRTRLAATTAAIPSVTPCGRPVKKRAASNVGRFSAHAVRRLPTVKTRAHRSRSFLRSILGVKAVMRGAPATTPIAYALTARPACGLVTPRSSAIHGSRLIEANSVVPTAKPPAAKAVMANDVELIRGTKTPFRILGCERLRRTGAEGFPQASRGFNVGAERFPQVRAAQSLTHRQIQDLRPVRPRDTEMRLST